MEWIGRFSQQQKDAKKAYLAHSFDGAFLCRLVTTTTVTQVARGLPVPGRSDACTSLQRDLSASVARTLLPERVMVRAVAHWSNTTSFGTQQCSIWRSAHSVWEAKHWEHSCGRHERFRAALSDGEFRDGLQNGDVK
jgi:hypothetical protein